MYSMCDLCIQEVNGRRAKAAAERCCDCDESLMRRPFDLRYPAQGMPFNLHVSPLYKNR